MPGRAVRVAGEYPTALGWALLAIIWSAVVAILLVPASGISADGALTLSGAVLALGILLGPAVACLQRPAAAFRAEHLMMLGLVYWLLLDVAQGAYALWGVSRGSILEIYLCVAIFAGALWLGSGCSRLIRPSLGAGVARAEIGVPFVFWAGIASFGLGMLRVTMSCGGNPACLVESFFQPRFEAAWYFGGGFGNWDTVLLDLQYFGYLVLPLSVGLAALERRLSWRSILLALLGLFFLAILIRNGGRRSVGTVIGASLLVWVLARGSFNWRVAIKLAVVLVGLLLLLQAMVAWRYVGFGSALTRGDSLEISGRSGLAVDRNFFYFAHLVSLVPDRYPHTGWQGVYYTVAAPIPRSVLPSKPVSRGFDLTRAIGMHTRPGFSWTASALGDLYLIAGLPAVAFGGWLFGLLAGWTSTLLRPAMTVRSSLIYAVTTMTLFVALRAIHELFVTSFVILALMGLLTLRRWAMRRVVTIAPVIGRRPAA